MIKHIVFFRLSGDMDKEERRQKANELAAIFSPLKDLDCVREYRVGVNLSLSDSAWDLAIDSTFDSEEDLESYRVSQEHRDSIARAKQYPKEKSVVDYKIQNK